VLLAAHLIDEAADRFFTTPTIGGLTGLLAPPPWPCWPAVTAPSAASPSDPDRRSAAGR
jgi:hypothetical protein